MKPHDTRVCSCQTCRIARYQLRRQGIDTPEPDWRASHES